MPRGYQSAYPDEQKRNAHHIQEVNEDKGISEKEAVGDRVLITNGNVFRI